MPRRYPAEVRQQVIELARSGTKVAQLAATFGMSDATIYNWLKQDRVDRGEIAETSYGGRRLIVRRVHLHAQEGQEELFAYWRHFAFLTNRGEDMHTVDAEHRDHAEVELAIRDLKDQALAHFPSGSFAANAAWTVIACLAHNLSRWVGQLGLEDETWRAARTIRRWLIALPGRLTRTARRFILHLPARWPWRDAFAEPQAARGTGPRCSS